MELVSKFFVRAREIVLRRTKGQTMTEYVLILGAIAIVVYSTYQLLGQNISSAISGVDSTLTSA
jgi:Flp pilus assembly pilin Flp